MFDKPACKKPDIVLDEDATAVVKRLIREVQGDMATLASFVNGQPLEHETARLVLKVTENRLLDLGKRLGVETESAAEHERRHVALRTANQKIHALEAQLGNAQSPELTQLALRAMESKLNDWWRQEGFGLVSEVKFGAYNCRVKFSCNLFGDFTLVESETPISDKERKRLWHESLRQRGFVLTEEHGEVGVLDCDASREALCAFISTRLPSAQVLSFENHVRRQSGYVLRGTEVIIRNLEDIVGLPIDTPEKTEGEI
jgi:hypothetical protein